MESDLNVYCLAEELLLDFEPGLSSKISERLNRFIVADDVQVVDVAPHYGLLSVQGPDSQRVLKQLGLLSELPARPFDFKNTTDANLGEIYIARQPRLRTEGFDLFVPVPGLGAVADKLIAATKAVGGRPCGWQAMETARIEAGVPRFGADMDEGNLPQECGIEASAVSYTKGCYIGQEVLNRVHTLGHVNRSLHGLLLADDLAALPRKGEKLLHAGKEVGFITSATRSPRSNRNIALGYVRREAAEPGANLVLAGSNGESAACISKLPFGFS
jgi:folate-binding protein YgfZ